MPSPPEALDDFLHTMRDAAHCEHATALSANSTLPIILYECTVLGCVRTYAHSESNVFICGRM